MVIASKELLPHACYRKYFPWGPRYNVVAVISTEGIVAIRICDAGVTVGAEEFVHCKSRGVAATPKRCIITLIRCNAEINTVRV
jgi:hypothetical protein